MRITSKEVKNIFDQLGHRALAMMGAKNKTYSKKEGSISFKIGRNAGNITHIKIYLNSKDLYDIEFLKIRGVKVKTVSSYNDVYVDMLHDLIEDETGMSLTL